MAESVFRNRLSVYKVTRKSNTAAEKSGQDENSCNMFLVTRVPKQACN